MPLYQLAVDPADVSGAALRLRLNAPAPVPLARHRLCHADGGALTLAVLGASHLVTVEHAAADFSEQVSCATDGPADTLPEHADGPGYRLESCTRTHDEPEFRRLARQLRSHCATETGWLGGTFPGDDAALTVLAARADGIGWRWHTWHLYPAARGGTVVRTASRWRP